jgi:hypothetical protein
MISRMPLAFERVLLQYMQSRKEIPNRTLSVPGDSRKTLIELIKENLALYGDVFIVHHRKNRRNLLSLCSISDIEGIIVDVIAELADVTIIFGSGSLYFAANLDRTETIFALYLRATGEFIENLKKIATHLRLALAETQ